MALLQIEHRFASLGGQSAYTVVLPESGCVSELPVVYLLHGASDNGTGWFRFTNAERYALEAGAALVAPCVGNSYYADMASGARYFSFVTEELPEECRRVFGFSPKREHNFLLGLSMGGYGAVKCALTYPERYAGCAALSAAVRPEVLVRREEWPLPASAADAIFGPRVREGELPAGCDLYALTERALQGGTELPALFLRCGEQDSLLAQNEALHAFWERRGVLHSYRTSPGAHSWAFWDAQLPTCLQALLSGKRQPEE